jgi:predicted nucleic acid-binding protein
MRAVFQYLLDGQIEITTSAITLTECLTKPIKDQLISLVQNYSVLFENTQGINVVPIDSTIGRRAAELRARYNLRTPDALHIATAIRTSCDAFLTNDFGIRRVTEIPILIPDELELDS